MNPALARSRPVYVVQVICTALFLFGTFGITGQLARAQEFDVAFIDELRIGDDETKPLEYLLQSPDKVAVDAEGRIYVSEGHLKVIRVFDAEGVHLATLGGEGKGPGEFGDVTSMALDRDGSLLVMDATNSRMTRFSELGKRVETVPWPVKFWTRAESIIPYENGYLMLYHWVEPGSPHSGRIFHVHSRDLLRVVKSFGKTTLFFDLDEPLERGMVQYPLAPNMAAVDAQGRIYFVRGPYDGSLHRLTKHDESVWRVHSLKGYQTGHPPFRTIEVEEFEKARPRHGFMLASADGVHAGVMHDVSRGLHVTPAGTVLHFFRMPPGGNARSDERVLVVQQFDSDGRYLGYGQFDARTLKGEVGVKAQDAAGRLYLVQYPEGAGPVVRRVRLQISPTGK